jgi:hypothetical protein
MARPTPNPAAMGAAALSLLSDPARRAAMGRAARASAVARFQPEPIVTRVEGIYREVLARQTAAADSVSPRGRGSASRRCEGASDGEASTMSSLGTMRSSRSR